LGRFPRVEGKEFKLLRDTDNRSSRCRSPTAHRVPDLSI
jgi:hypothetical protein